VPAMGGCSIFCFMYLKRSVLDKIGGLDEDIGEYGWQDNLFFEKYEANGYRDSATAKAVYATHLGSASFRRQGRNMQEEADRMYKIYKQKGGLK